jgi:hypothetical protein
MERIAVITGIGLLAKAAEARARNAVQKLAQA